MTAVDQASVDRLRHALHAAWGDDTCAPEDRKRWHADRPSTGQCITTVLVVHDLFGGDLVRGDVHVDGRLVDHHWWNRLPDGIELDLTRDQFAPHEVVSGSTAFPRPLDGGRVAAQYAVLRGRIEASGLLSVP